MSQQKANSRSLTFSIRNDLTGTFELIFKGLMTKPFLSSSRFALNSITNNQIATAYLDLTDVKQIDDIGIDFLTQLVKAIEREGIKFQLVYRGGRVGSKIEASGLASIFKKPTWTYK